MHEDQPTNITVSKEQASNLSIGDKVSITVKGVVTGIREKYYMESGPMDMKKEKKKEPQYFDVELKKTSVSGIEGNKANKEYDKMIGKNT